MGRHSVVEESPEVEKRSKISNMKKIFIMLLLPMMVLSMYPGPPKQYKKGPKYGYRYDRRYGRPEYRRRYQKEYKYDDYPPCHYHKRGQKAPKDEPSTPIEHEHSSGDSMTSRNPDHLFITDHPSEIEKFKKYFTPRKVFQPNHGIDHEHDSNEHHDHHQDMPKVPDFSLCSHQINADGNLLISTRNAPDCPLMDFDEAQNFCLDHGMRSVSLSSSLSFGEKKHKLHIADMTPNGYWTLGFIENPNKPTVVWGDEMDEIVEELWADGQPDGPKEGTMGSIEFCVAVQKSQTHRKLAKLHDKLCNTKLSAVCERVNPV